MKKAKSFREKILERSITFPRLLKTSESFILKRTSLKASNKIINLTKIKKR